MAKKTICVVGLGYIGLPTAAMFANNGIDVFGVDVSERVVNGLRAGRIHIEEPGLEEAVTRAISNGSLTPMLAPLPADAFIIAVPSPKRSDHSADLAYIHEATRSILPYLEPGNLVILESTSPPGTTLGLISILESTGLRVGEDIFLAHSPERVLPGRIMHEMIANDRIIGGHTQEAAQAAAELYRSFVNGEILLTDATTAEMSKLMENAFRDVNIALANEFSRVAETVGINVHEAIRLANHHPRVNVLQPGPGVGGHCIAVDPWFIVHAAPEESQLIQTARRINDTQPVRVAEAVEALVRDIAQPTIGVLGLAYKPDIDDARESPSIEVVKLLRERGYHLKLHDAHAKVLPDGLELISDLQAALAEVDLVLVLTHHQEYRSLTPDSAEVGGVRHLRIFDTRNIIDARFWQQHNWQVHQLGVAQDYAYSLGHTT